VSRPGASGNRKFESTSLHRGVPCEPDFLDRVDADALTVISCLARYPKVPPSPTGAHLANAAPSQAGLFPETAPQCSGFGQVMRCKFEVTKINPAVDQYRPSMGFAPKVRFSPDSLLEGGGFEPLVPLTYDGHGFQNTYSTSPGLHSA
jgi:hypothetical protein